MSKPQLFSGQGKLYMALITAGVVGAYQFAGNVTAASLTPTVTKTEHKESTSGKRAVDDVLYGEQKVGFSFTGEDHQVSALARVLRGAVTVNAGASVTDFPLPAGAKNGDFVSLGAVNLSAILIESGAGVALVADRDYRVESAKHGLIEIIDETKFATAANAAYTSGASSSFEIMSESAQKFRVRFDGLNTVADGKEVLVEFDTLLEPAKVLQLIADAYQNYEVSGDVLFVNGSFGKVTVIG